MPTDRLYYRDAYLGAFTANIVRVADDGRRVYLDRSALYPESGGQPSDRGTLGAATVLDVVDEGDEVAHLVDRALAPGPVAGVVDWQRRFDFMQQHTGQHLVSAVIQDRFGWETVSVHLGVETSTVDVTPASVTPEQLEEAERLANTEIWRNRPVSVTFEDASLARGLRKPVGRSGEIRIVTIEGLDRSACGGTHVRATGEIGMMLLVKTEKVRGQTRIHFVGGARCATLARSYAAELRHAVADSQQRIGTLEKEMAKLRTALGGYRGRELFEKTPPGADGVRRAAREVDAIDDSIRAEANAFTASGPALFVCWSGNALAIGASPGTGIDAGAWIKARAKRGGGTPLFAQGTFDDPAAAALELLPPR
ncbi:MAG TPA: alanyl-tRNA editing protein [Vicinamibacterales bacterium]|nr:alanyl-tRNA editing protein [Vicinamibacterales bacterium]